MTSPHIPASDAAEPSTSPAEDARTVRALVTGSVRCAPCPFCDAQVPGPCQLWPPADHLARWLAAEAAGRITRDDLIAAIGGLDVIAVHALVAERSPATAATEGTSASGTPRSRAAARTARGTLTIAEICEDLGISRRTFYEWRAKRKAPHCISLPNGSLRVRRAEYQRWLQNREDTA